MKTQVSGCHQEKNWTENWETLRKIISIAPSIASACHFSNPATSIAKREKFLKPRSDQWEFAPLVWTPHFLDQKQQSTYNIVPSLWHIFLESPGGLHRTPERKFRDLKLPRFRMLYSKLSSLLEVTFIKATCAVTIDTSGSNPYRNWSSAQNGTSVVGHVLCRFIYCIVNTRNRTISYRML